LTTTISSLLVNFRNGVGIRTFCDIDLLCSFALEKYFLVQRLCVARYYRTLNMIGQVFG
jgi:hypothetical protein